MSGKKYKTIHKGPVTGSEPGLLHDFPQDKFMAALVTLASELYIVRDRMRVLEAELQKHNVLPPNAVDGHNDTPEEEEQRAKDAQAFADRFWLQLTGSDEPVSHIDPKIKKYL